MIVFTNAFLLSEAATATPLTHPRIGYQTWLRDLAASAVTVSSESASGPKDAPLRPDTAEYWEPTSLPATWTVDMGAGRDVDYAGIVGTIGSSGCSIEVETSDGSFAGSPSEQVWVALGSAVAPADDAPILVLDDSRMCRYVRLTITGGSVMPRVSVVYAGEILAVQRPIYGGHSPLTLARETVLHRSLSRGGQFLGQGFRRHGVSGDVSIQHLTAAWYRANFDPFVKDARRYPFFFGWRPATFPLEAAYVWAPDDIRPSNMGKKDLMQVAFKVFGVGHE